MAAFRDSEEVHSSGIKLYPRWEVQRSPLTCLAGLRLRDARTGSAGSSSTLAGYGRSRRRSDAVGVAPGCHLRASTPRRWQCTGQGLCIVHTARTPAPHDYAQPSSNGLRPSCSALAPRGRLGQRSTGAPRLCVPVRPAREGVRAVRARWMLGYPPGPNRLIGPEHPGRTERTRACPALS